MSFSFCSNYHGIISLPNRLAFESIFYGVMRWLLGTFEAHNLADSPAVAIYKKEVMEGVLGI